MLPLMLAGGGVAAILAVVGFVVMQRSGNPKRENAPTVGALISDGLPASDPSVDEKTKGAPATKSTAAGSTATATTGAMLINRTTLPSRRQHGRQCLDHWQDSALLCAESVDKCSR